MAEILNQGPQLLPPTNVNILNAVRNELDLDLQNRIPEANLNNLQEVYDAMIHFSATRDRIIPSLIERIGLQTIDSMVWKNPLVRYAKSPMRYGQTHEETYVNMCKGKLYDMKADFAEAFRIYQSYILTMFHKVNFNMQYPVTVTFDNLRFAFPSEYGIRDMIQAKMSSVVTGEQWDEFEATKSLFDTGYEKGVLPAVHVPAVTDAETGRQLLVEVKSAVDEFKFPKPINNIAGATSFSNPENLLWITFPRVNAHLSVQDLAYAFHLDKIDVETQTVLIDSLQHPQIQGILCDVRFFNIRDHFREMSDQKLANILSWNYFYTVVMMITPSPFYPMRVFTTDNVNLNGISTEVTDAYYVPGQDTEMSLVVTGGGGNHVYNPNNWDFEIRSGATGETIFIPGTNILHADQNQTADVRIRWTNRYDRSVYGEKVITLEP